jgi:hypothetical protein
VLVQLQANINMQEFTAEAFIAGSTFGKYTIRGRGSGRRITCRPPPL